MGSKSNKIAPEQDPHIKWATTRPGVRLRIRYLSPTLPASSHIDTTLSQTIGDQGQPQSTDKTKAIFFIHGVGGSSDIWAAQIAYFSDRGYYIIVPDLLGHGFSSAPDKPSLYKFELIAMDVTAIFDQMHKDVNIVIGHSYGTSFAAYLARTRSSRVDKLVLMSGGAPVALSPQAGVLSLPSLLLTCIKPVLVNAFHKSAFHKKNKDIPNKEKAFDVPVYVLRHTMKGQVWEEGDEEFHKWIVQPTLLLHGEADRLESVDNTLEMHKVLARSEIYTIPNASHMIMMEQPASVNRLIDRFIHSELPILNTNMSQAEVTHQPSNSHSNSTKSQPNLRRATLTG